ncbi:MAG TPA: SusC/RagA family TonB-linked outer membrane protein [Gemmatimonadales bacterium]|nr:SusC/RagA family TonB-linked outer membrane protein [Gemmatimonadales bacterium]
MHLNVRSVCAAAGLWLSLASRVVAQEPVTITGKATGDGGQALGQVEVAIPSMGLGGLSRDDGTFAIVIPGARVSGQTVTLVARRLGYKSQSAQVTLTSGGGGVSHDFVLAANPLQLGEVVVTGAGTSAAANALGSVRNNVAADQIERASETNMVEALAGKAPNVNVLQASGDPGASAFINIRGISTLLGNNQPLFVIDGVPADNSTFSTSNFNAPDDAGGTLIQAGQTEGTVSTNRAADINPNDIESVEILKGPSASAIYGARAAAGVVLITTKSGRSGPTHFSFRSSTSFNDINHAYPLQTGFGQGTNGIHADTSLGGTCDTPGASSCARSWGPPIPAGATVFDHSNEIYQLGHTLDNGFTVSGGNDRTTFYLSGDYNHDQGVIVGPNNVFNRSTVRFKGTHRVIDNVKLGADLSFADTRARYTQRGNNTNGIQLGDLRTPPDFNNMPYVVQTNAGPQQRSYRLQHPTDFSLLDDRTFDNPFWTAFQSENSANVGRVYGNMNAEYLPVAWLKVNYTLGADYWTDERLEGCPVSSSSPCIAGRVVEGKIVNYSIDHNLTATANYTVNENLGGTVTLGQNLSTRNNRQLGTVGRTLVALQPFKLSNTVTQDLPLDQETVIHDASWFGQAGLDVSNQLHLIAALRNDGSSTFGSSNLRSWFPKGSVAWEFTKAIGEQSWLSYGKARVAYGEAGQEPLPYLTSLTFTSGLVGAISQGTGNTPTQNGIGGLVTRSELRPAATLKPERSKEFEAGVDLGFFKDKADASITWYNKKSSDIILLSPLNPSIGFFAQGANAATMRNRGWEVSLNVRPLQKADYGWDVGLQWARNRNLVLSVGQPVPATCTATSTTTCPFIPIGDFNNQVAMVNQPIGAYLGSGFLRCGISSNASVVDTLGTTMGAVCAGKPNGALYIGADGYPVQDQDPRIVQDPNYDWTGSIRSSFRYKKLQISGLLDIRHGGQIWNGPKGALWSYGTHGDTQQRATCTDRNDPASCTGNPKIFGQGGWYDGPVVGPGAGQTVSIGEYFYRNVVACPFIGIDEPCIEDAGFVKLREVSVTYTLDAPWVQRSLGFSSIDLRVSGRNLKTWTNYTGYDPETNLGGAISANAGAGGVDYFNNPQTRSFVFSVTLNH